MKVFYARVSTLEQKTERQRINDKEFDLIVEDKCSGSIPFFEREGGKKFRLIDISYKTLEDFNLYLKSKNLIYSSVGKSIKRMKTLFNSYVIKREKINIDLSFK